MATLTTFLIFKKNSELKLPAALLPAQAGPVPQQAGRSAGPEGGRGRVHAAAGGAAPAGQRHPVHSVLLVRHAEEAEDAGHQRAVPAHQHFQGRHEELGKPRGCKQLF